MRHCLTAAWRAMRWFTAFVALCQLLIDLIKEVYDAAPGHRRAGMRGTELF